MDLAEFLLARIAEDEEAARAEWDWMIERHGADAWTTGEGKPIPDEWRYETDRDWTLHVSPRRVLAECDAKRRIVEHAEVVSGMDNQLEGEWGHRSSVPWDEDEGVRLLRYLALPHAEHPEYQQKWRP